MRRLLIANLLLIQACLSGASAPSAVSTLQVSSNVSPNGVFVGDQVQLNAEPLDFNGNVVPVPVTYSSSNASVARVTNSGLITAVGVGTSTISVSAGGQTARMSLTVDGNVTGSILVTPAQPDIGPGHSILLIAAVSTTLGNPARNKAVTWSTSDAAKVSIDQTGTATGVAATPGVSVCATANDAPAVKGCTTVIVQ